jgi:methyl-accepting chemotaxis protein
MFLGVSDTLGGTTMSIKMKMTLLSAVTIATVCLVAIFAGYTLSSLRGQFRNYESQSTLAMDLVEIKATALSVAKDDPIKPETANALRAADTRIQALERQISELEKDKAITQAMKRVSDLWVEYLRQFNSAIKIASDNPVDALQIPDAIYTMQLLPMVTELNHLVKDSIAREAASKAAITGSMARILWVILAPLLAGGLFIVVSQGLFASKLKRRVENVQRIVGHLETGDLTQRLPMEGNDEITAIARAVNSFIERTHETLHQVREGAGRVSAAASLLFGASERIAKRTIGQSQAASSVAATVEQVTVSVNHVAEHTREAHAISVESGALSVQGGEVVLLASDEMARISQSVRESSNIVMDLEKRSADISAIVEVIKNVADQTNLLALNAAIEAARAGEQGRGFAVVADEVRNLAERTAQSTQEIAGVITEIQEATRVAVLSMETGVQRVDKGVALATQVGESITRVKNSTERVVSVVDGISAALQEQSAASDDIAQKVERIAYTSGENSEAVQHTVATARELDELSGSLEQAVNRFRL